MGTSNPFAQAIRARRVQLGLFLGLASPFSAEICATSGADWLLIDGEHGPNDLQTIAAQLQAIAAHPPTHAIARVPYGFGDEGTSLIKQYLDLGVQTIMVPMVETAEQAGALVRAMRYPPEGVRGASVSRASLWRQSVDYAREANDNVCLLVQIESLEGIRNLESIAVTEGVDGVFIGPGDLAADMGYAGNSGAPQVREVVRDAIKRVIACGKAAGTMSMNEVFAREYLDAGVTFISVGFDASLLVKSSEAAIRIFRQPAG
ncbi:4-hydroxy-2-oxoheptanedioate aldolase [soil metagenome]